MDPAKPDAPDTLQKLIGSEVWSLLEKLGKFFDAQNIEAYLVGGWVRDVLLGRQTADIDIAVDADAFDIATRIAAELGGKCVLLDRENRIARVVLPPGGNQDALIHPLPRHLDFSSIEGAIRVDLSQRDFTINAMALSLNRLSKEISEAQIIDLYKGRADIKLGIIRVVSDKVFAADSVRLLRAVRLASELGFRIDEQSESLIRRDARLVATVAGERVREELVRILDVFGGRPVRYLDELGLLVHLIPELDETKGVEQPKEHHWEVFEHSLRSVAAVDYLLRRGDWEFGGASVLTAVPWSAMLAEHFEMAVGFSSTRRVMLKLAGLLHDVNKPQTKAFDAEGRMRFLGHPLEGAATVVRILERLRFSGKEVTVVETEVLHHMRPSQMSSDGMPTNRAVYRYFRDTGEAAIDILFLNLADHLATRGPDLRLEGWLEHTRLVDYVIRKSLDQEKVVSPPKLVDGYDIIKSFGVTPGPELGEILEQVREAQAAGEVTTREEALSFINERLKKKNV